ncbi:GNAT family N-acetyltransferase [Paenibacillus donghaensis]|uniref:GNAT family N-acetyltransferase n=1 Tax=Paenibacillus donghaensis TaxID=414771 RepID=A0A2Z2KEU7_9BACL|nr:GNAT family N-acetyltransferase [Paenibacillus donghaensis]ASA24624.1 GNAT family N-acetyltransferase [Paenibacillus donghaensis]
MLIQSDVMDIRRTAVEDLDFVLEVEQDELNRHYVAQWSRGQHKASLTDGDFLHLTMLEKTGERLGYVLISGLQDRNLAVCLRRIVIQTKGQGYGTALLPLLTEWIFTQTEAHRLWLDVVIHNHRAQHVYQMAGFTLEGTLRECLKMGETYETMQIMSLLRHEYES